MSSVDERVVAMKLDNKQFEAGAKSSLGILGRLKAALSFKNSTKGIDDLQNKANKFSLQGLASGASGVASKFSAMSVVAAAAIGSIVVKAVDAGLRVAKAFTLDPLKQGFQEYETQLNSVQTILANTQASGATLKDVNATLNELNTYSDKTIYNFSEMARNIGTFTAAGVDLKTATGSIKGIANLAALSGSNSQQASTAMYQLSQAISSGRVSLQDWNSVVNAGMGGTVFQRALAQTAEKMGTLDKGAVKLTGKMKNATINGKSFRESITAKPGEKSWLTSDVLTATLKQFTGDMTDAELAAQGFNKSQIRDIQAQAKTAQDAATQVKTFTQLIGTLQEAAGSGYAQTAQIIVGDFEEAKKLFTGISNVVGGYVSNSAKARNQMLQTWKDLGGRTALLKGLGNVFKFLVAVIKPIRDAFREIFPPTTGKQLFQFTQQFLEFTKKLKIGAETSKDLKRTFKGVFAIFSIGVSLIKAVANVIGDLFGLLGKGSGDFLSVTGSIGDFLVKLDQTIKKGDLFNKFFKTVGAVIGGSIGDLKNFGNTIKNFFGDFKVNPFEAIAAGLSRLRDRLSPLIGAASLVSKAWDAMIKAFQKIGDFLAPVIDYISTALSGIGDKITESLKNTDYNKAFDVLNTGLLAGLVLVVKKFLSGGLKIDFGGGLVKSIQETFGALTDTLSALQSQVQANTLITIAAAVALLVASIVAMSLIDSKKLTKALAGIGVAFGQLLTAMTILTKVVGTKGFLKIPFIAGSMILLAGAVLILTAAVKVLSGLSWEELMKGLIGVGALLGMIVLASAGLNKAGGPMIRAGLAMIPLAIGLKILASVVKDFAGMSWGEMAKGLAGLAGSLVVIAGAMRLMPKNIAGQALGLLVVSVALNLIAKAIQSMGGMSWEEIAKGMVALGGSLLILAAGLALMSGALPGAAALIVAAVALAIIAPVLKTLGDLSWEAIAKGMVALAGSMLILAGGLALMTAALPGAAALLVAAAALAIIAPVLVVLGAMSWESILKGLAGLAGVFLVLGLAGLALTPVIPSILLLAGALLILGTGIGLIGAGALALATAFAIFTAAGTAGIAILTAMINLIPIFMSKFAEGIIGFATTLASQATVFVGAFVTLLVALIDAVIKITPKLAQMLNVMIAAGLSVIRKNFPAMAATGLSLMITFLTMIGSQIPKLVALAANIIVRFLQSMKTRIPQIVSVATDLILKFMSSIEANAGRLMEAGAKLVINLINRLASTIRSNQAAMNAAGQNLASAIISGMTSGIFGGIGSVISAAKSMAQQALSAAKAALDINSPSKKFAALGNYSSMGYADGLSAGEGMVARSAKGVAGTALDTMRSALEDAGKGIGTDLNLRPTITPVLDLSDISRGAGAMVDILGQQALRADVSYRQALGVANASARSSSEASSVDRSVKYEYKQYNTSPKALSASEIYRNTKSLLALTKGEVEQG